MYTNTQYMAGTCGKLERHQNTLLTIWIVQRQQRIVIKTRIQNRGQCERMRKRRGRWNGKKKQQPPEKWNGKERNMILCVYIEAIFLGLPHTHVRAAHKLWFAAVVGAVVVFIYWQYRIKFPCSKVCWSKRTLRKLRFSGIVGLRGDITRFSIAPSPSRSLCFSIPLKWKQKKRNMRVLACRRLNGKYVDSKAHASHWELK